MRQGCAVRRAATVKAAMTVSDPSLLLTVREREVLRQLGAGAANKQIARALGVSVRTVETHRLNLQRKLGIRGQTELIRYARALEPDQG